MSVCSSHVVAFVEVIFVEAPVKVAGAARPARCAHSNVKNVFGYSPHVDLLVSCVCSRMLVCSSRVILFSEVA
jgi:hypothetical protein